MSMKMPDGTKKELSYDLQDLLVREAIATQNRHDIYPNENTIFIQANFLYKEDGISFSTEQISNCLKRMRSLGSVIPMEVKPGDKVKETLFVANVYARKTNP